MMPLKDRRAFLLPGLLAFLGGCDINRDIRDYAGLTTQTIVELDSKIRDYAADTARINAARRQVLDQQTVNLEESAAMTRRLTDSWIVSDDKERLRLFAALQQASEHAGGPAQAAPHPEVAIEPVRPIGALTATAKATDELSKSATLPQRVTFFGQYAQAVQSDIKKLQAAKEAENAAKPVIPPSAKPADATP